MKTEISTGPLETELVTSSRTRDVPRTKKQISATVLSDGLAVKERWKTLIVEASAIWGKLYPEELTNVHGNFHILAGLVQLRYKIDREESDRQVKAFFDKYYPGT